jgi:hypothetical protein
MLERQVAWLRALEDLVDVRGRAPKIVDQVRSVAHQAPGFDVFAELAYRGQPMLERLCRDSTRLLQEEPIGQNDGGIGAFFRHHGEFALDFLYCACLRQHDLNPDLLRGGHDPYHSRGMPRVLRLHQHGDTRQFWHGRLQQLEQFRPESRAPIDRPVMFPPGRAMLAAKPSPTGSPMTVLTTGMVMVACCSAR